MSDLANDFKRLDDLIVFEMANYIAFEARKGTKSVPLNSLFVLDVQDEKFRLKFKRSKRDIRSIALVTETKKAEFIDVLEFLSENEDIDDGEY